MSQPLLGLTRRFRYVVLLGAVVAGCSTNSSVSPAGNAQLGPSPAANARRSLQLSQGFGEALTPRTRASTWMAPDLKGGALNIYWGDYYNNTITIYPRGAINPPEKGVITEGLSHPQRLFVDSVQTIYATNAGNNTITAYKRNATKPSLTIGTGVDNPTGLTVDAAGTVYCANTGGESVTVYPKGQTTPSLTIPIAGSPEYLAIDGSDNLYVSYLGGSKGTGVMEFAPGSTLGKDLGLDVSGSGPIAIDRSGNIILVDDYGLAIDIFPAGQTEPSKKIGVSGGEIFGLSLSEKEHKLFVSVESGWFIVQQFDYPSPTNLTTKL
ncbi:MAG: hypothetical protein WB615_08330, partial [Candidatus Tumulicola sp.]